MLDPDCCPSAPPLLGLGCKEYAVRQRRGGAFFHRGGSQERQGFDGSVEMRRRRNRALPEPTERASIGAEAASTDPSSYRRMRGESLARRFSFFDLGSFVALRAGAFLHRFQKPPTRKTSTTRRYPSSIRACRTVRPDEPEEVVQQQEESGMVDRSGEEA